MTNEQALVDQAAEIQAALSRFHGCETFYRYWTGRLIYTEGVKYLADTAHCYWLIDAIASHQPKCRKDMMLAGLPGLVLAPGRSESCVLGFG
ncbi:hypothetical protein AVDCRST_MAG94-444 [uncultured Leptolyngbya sp.]|uniref:DUF6876 domain-containing protein n=1 Tax=uncultured Leptolyngbya sp. TaxID=332963 RepID=A0A6J4KCW2_9CYAN|nr:hypothetical protein AVDCRST_MAG94-444 [uncultured Leptolyngbya sp.]